MKFQKFVIPFFLLISIGYLEAIQCPTGYSVVGSKCLKAYTDEELSWEDAETFCETDGGHLAYINDCSLMRIITNFLGNDASQEKYWIGASDTEEEGTWLWLDGSEVQLRAPFWGTSAPGWEEEPNGGNGENCAALDQNDQFYIHDEDCETKLNVLCEISSVVLDTLAEDIKKKEVKYTSCPDGFQLISSDCFYFHFDSSDESTKTTYTEGQTICNDLDSRLAILDDCNLFGEVVAYIRDNADVTLPSKASYWIGATDEGVDGTWIWDGTYDDLYEGSPFWGSMNGIAEPNGGENQNCALLFADNFYYFHDGECYKKAYPLCQLL